MLAIKSEWAAPADCDAVVVGSVIQSLPADWAGVIAGAGKLRAEAPIPTGAYILGLRGHLSAEGVHGDFAIGDPGLLVDELIAPQEKVYNLGVVPHWSDHELAPRFAHLRPFVINPAWPPGRVLTEIARCKKVVSSSLHGIVAADAFGIPRRAEMFPRMASEGLSFKFSDYASAIRFPMEFGVLQSPPRFRVEHVQAEVFEMMLSLGNLFRA